MIEIKESSIADKEWNKRLIESGFGTIYQSKEQGEHHIRQGRIPIYLQFFNEQQIVGQLLVGTVSRFRQNNLKSNFLKKIPTLKKISCYWTYGPIVFDKNFNNEIYFTLANYLKEKKFVASGWQNPLCSYEITNSNINFTTKPWSTFIINLTQSKEEISSLIDKHSGIKNIQRSIKRGVEVEQINDQNFIEYAKLRILESNQMITDSELENKMNWNVNQIIESPIKGPKGNVEYLIYANK